MNFNNVDCYHTGELNISNLLEQLKIEEDVDLENFKALISGKGSESAIKSGYIEITCKTSLTLDEVCDELSKLRSMFRELTEKHSKIVFV